jgi:cell division protein FtsB
MSYKNLSLGSGKESESPSIEAFGEGNKESLKREKNSSSPWDSLRPIEPKADEPKPPSRIGRFFRKALRWLTGLIVVFGLGVGTTWFVRVQPMNRQIEDLKNQLETAEITVGELEALIADYKSAESENEAVEEDLRNTELHVDIMRILVDAVSAELALANDDIVTAKASLTGTDTRLAELQERLQGEDQETIEGMRTRLVLVLEELETDAFAAMSDLEVFASNLIALERSLFGN